MSKDIIKITLQSEIKVMSNMEQMQVGKNYLTAIFHVQVCLIMCFLVISSEAKGSQWSNSVLEKSGQCLY